MTLQSPFSSSSSRSDSQSLEQPSTSSRIPESNARSEPWSAQEYSEATRKRRRICIQRPIAVTNNRPNPSIKLNDIQYDENKRFLVSQGVLQEGNHIIITHQHPAVSQCLGHIRKTYTLPSCTPETVLALCALEVFLHPTDSAHWLFWSNERKTATLELVNRICDASPALILPSRTWSESMLYSLPQLHGQAWHDILRDEPWYATLVGGRPTEPPRGPTLRKRKAPTETPQSLSSDPSDDLPVPATKRMRVERTQPPPKPPAIEPTPELTTNVRSSTPILTQLASSAAVLPSRRESARPIRRPAKFNDPEWSEPSSRSSSRSPLSIAVLLPSVDAEPEPSKDVQSDPSPGRASSSSARTLIGSEGDSRASSPMSDLTTFTLVESESDSVSGKTRASTRKGRGTRIKPSAGLKATAPSVIDDPPRVMTRARARVRAAN